MVTSFVSCQHTVNCNVAIGSTTRNWDVFILIHDNISLFWSGLRSDSCPCYHTISNPLHKMQVDWRWKHFLEDARLKVYCTAQAREQKWSVFHSRPEWTVIWLLNECKLIGQLICNIWLPVGHRIVLFPIHKDRCCKMTCWEFILLLTTPLITQVCRPM